jgi:excisionase family DNA binding protein
METANEQAEVAKLPIEPRSIGINDFCAAIGISRSCAYGLINRNEIQTIHIGRRRLIPMTEVDRLISDAVTKAVPSGKQPIAT